MNVRIYYSSSTGELTKNHPTDSGFDLEACIGSEEIVLNSMERTLIPTGIRLLLPENMKAQVRPRSGLAIKHGLTVLNSPGTIDNEYRGEIKVIVINLGQEPVRIWNGRKIAQLVFSPVVKVSLTLGKDQPNTDTSRNIKGFGSSDPT